MSTHHQKTAAALVFGLGLAGAPALAQTGPGADPSHRGGAQHTDTSEAPGPEPGAVQPGAISESASSVTPQFWIADAALFVSNAANTAHTMAAEQQLNVQAPAVAQSQADFLKGSTSRALASVKALQQHAEGNNPAAAAEIVGVIGQLVAAESQAEQAQQSAASGALGPTYEATVRSTFDHLQSADKALRGIARSYGSQNLALVGTCSMNRAFGAGLGRAPAATKPATPSGTKGTGTPAGAKDTATPSGAKDSGEKP